jgi:hypothetical protein
MVTYPSVIRTTGGTVGEWRGRFEPGAVIRAEVFPDGIVEKVQCILTAEKCRDIIELPAFIILKTLTNRSPAQHPARADFAGLEVKKCCEIEEVIMIYIGFDFRISPM